MEKDTENICHFFLINQCIVPARCVHFDFFLKQIVEYVPSHSSSSSPQQQQQEKYRSKPIELNWSFKKTKSTGRYFEVCLCVCVCECVCCCRLSWDRKAFHPPPRKRRTEKREISNNSSHKWKRVKWFCFQLFVHSDNFCTKRDHHVWACVKRRKRETEKQREKDGK